MNRVDPQNKLLKIFKTIRKIFGKISVQIAIIVSVLCISLFLVLNNVLLEQSKDTALKYAQHLVIAILVLHPPPRSQTLSNLNKLPKAVTVDSAEVISFIERNRIFGTGIGYVDAHLLVATTLASNLRLWTRDKKLRSVAEKLAILAAALD